MPSREKPKEDRDCERECNSLLVPGFKERFGKPGDKSCYDKKENDRQCCFYVACAMQ